MKRTDTNGPAGRFSWLRLFSVVFSLARAADFLNQRDSAYTWFSGAGKHAPGKHAPKVRWYCVHSAQRRGRACPRASMPREVRRYCVRSAQRRGQACPGRACPLFPGDLLRTPGLTDAGKYAPKSPAVYSLLFCLFSVHLSLLV